MRETLATMTSLGHFNLCGHGNHKGQSLYLKSHCIKKEDMKQLMLPDTWLHFRGNNYKSIESAKQESHLICTSFICQVYGKTEEVKGHSLFNSYQTQKA